MNFFKMNITGRILQLLLSAALISFLAFGIVSFFNIADIFKDTISIGKDIGEKLSIFTEKYAINQAEKRLYELALEKSQRIERGMSDIKNDVEAIAFQMQQIFAQPERYKPISIPNHKEKPIYSGEAYIHYAPEVVKNGITEELKNEVGLTSNIADTLRIKASFNKGHETSSYIGSKNGYLICIDTLKDENGTVIFTKDFDETYDPRERLWYKEAVKQNKTTITDCYLSADGYLAVTCATPYFDAKGDFAGVAAVGASLDSLYQQLTDDSFGNTNINFALSKKNGEVVLSSTNTGTFAVSKEHKDLRKISDATLAKEIEKMVAPEAKGTALVSVDGKEYYLAYAPITSINWSFGTLIERKEIKDLVQLTQKDILEKSNEFATNLKNVFTQYIVQILISLVIIIVLIIWISINFSKRFVSPIVKLTNGVKEIAKGNLDKKLNIKTGDEIEVLSDSVNNMTIELKDYMQNLSNAIVEKERIATELNVAKNIQAGMLPSVVPEFYKNKFDLAAFMNPAKEVGGDFYDFYMLDENHLALTVADVSGKGVGAALFMVISKTILKNYTIMASSYNEGEKPNLAYVMEQVNLQLVENNKEHMFVTVFYGILDINTGEFVYVNAGHNPPLVRHKGEDDFSYIRSEKRNRVIGVSKKSKYQEQYLTLLPGDMMFIYTDGITEAMNEQRELFNENRLKSALDRVEKDSNSNGMLSTVYKAVKQHEGNADQSDDITMLGLVYRKGEI